MLSLRAVRALSWHASGIFVLCRARISLLKRRRIRCRRLRACVVLGVVDMNNGPRKSLDASTTLDNERTPKGCPIRLDTDK